MPSVTSQAEQKADPNRVLCQKRRYEDVTEPLTPRMASVQATERKRSKGERLDQEEPALLQVTFLEPTHSKRLPLSRSSVASSRPTVSHPPWSPLASKWSLKQGLSVFSLSAKKHASPPPSIASTLKDLSSNSSDLSLAYSTSSQSLGSPSPSPSGDTEQDTDQDDRDKTFKCSVGTCSKSFVHRQSLRRHIRDNHNPSGQPLYVCGIHDCTAVYTHPCKRRRHWQSKHPDECASSHHPYLSTLSAGS